ncbi:Endo-beta-N-acetylglucosaminidase [Candidatus Arthromitus sp. SFB-mouse-SU]|uniref:endo-beta-N-acetylglucosaminidase n=1 Tax=Candidatus Arthromitus sp. SFB-mouse TaxID=49118 RepID=UPI0002296871|nr:discoidin domain-containing protein [Candidatus Arthromitus sp. SFB-mouse]EGX28769.1 mannosyl-glycoprotein endo-beta-N-acetylglucosaminidase [Candidatus Arthromitus sp. SFB-mouse-NYU]EIA23890.1 Endo-beta-N-acetylglucosaminidase [Candidatus Arthromitus sp. SFB-2]EIA30824.1 Endo-beta-N-acetylglucosaminidase [Candidatus Arthromitus sp. SFB-mouse-SU]BAK79870.1 F5/8 type C domain protein [Candidatus Arthromitus sp. SFB-mouse-Yit]
MNKLKLKRIIAMSMFLAIGIMSCSERTVTTSSNNISTINYSVTGEAEEAENIKISNMPITPFWFPEELLKWDPTKDEDIKYNKATIPLAERVSKENLPLINKTQNKDFNIVVLSMMNESTSGNSPQGLNKFDSNTFSYWQYIDKLVYWGGSSGEGIIVPPSADVINSAHKNGVPVLGTIFFPTTEHGGKAEWVEQFLYKDENGNFPMIDKLIEVCEVLGFDGWFINQETGLTIKENNFIDQSETVQEGAKITKTHAELMQEFIREFNKKSDYEIMWYDSLTKDGEMDWQNALTEKNDYFLIDADKEKVADSMFLNFWWTTNRLAEQELLRESNLRAISLGINPYSLYAGIDIQANGTNTQIRWGLLTDDNNIPYTSLGIYCPSWTFFSSNNVDEFMSKENRLWVNELGDPRANIEDAGFIGMSTYAVENTVINSIPFTTNFNIGNGYNFFVNGEKVSSMDWNNRSLADVMPTYRWIIDNEGDNSLKASIDYSKAYYGGNSIKLAGNLKANTPSEIKLFSSDLKIENDTQFTTILSASSDVSIKLILDFDDGSSEEIEGNTIVSSDWTKVNFDVSKFTSKVIRSISYKILSDKDVSNISVNFGNISINSKNANVSDIISVNVDNVVFEEDMYAGVRLSFDASNKNDVKHYEIYKVNEDESLTFLGASINENYFVNALTRDNKSNTTTFEVVAVNNDLSRGNGMRTKIEWPDNSIPKSDFTASKTLISPGEEITFTNLSSQVTENLEWTFEGATVQNSTEISPTVKYENEGTYKVSLKAKNSSGEDIKTIENYITVTKDAENFKNLSNSKNAEASSFVNSNEAPNFAFDGKLDTKWCATGTPPHNITVDLGSVSLISEVKIAHAEAGGESDSMNTSAYIIEVSEDGDNFTEIVNVKKNSKANTIDTFKAIPARYVRVIATKPTQGSDSAVRIYEIEVSGIQK